MSYSSAYVFPNEGLDYMMSVIPKNGSVDDPIYLGLWGSWDLDNNPTYTTTWNTISGYATNGNTDITVNSGTYYVYEVGGDTSGFVGYTSRTALNPANWSANASTTVNVPGNAALPVRYSTYQPAVQFTNGGTTVSGINGIFLAVGADAGTIGSASSPTNTVLWYAPFSDYSSVTLASGDSISITPTWQSASFQS